MLKRDRNLVALLITLLIFAVIGCRQILDTTDDRPDVVDPSLDIIVDTGEVVLDELGRILLQENETLPVNLMLDWDSRTQEEPSISWSTTDSSSRYVALSGETNTSVLVTGINETSELEEGVVSLVAEARGYASTRTTIDIVVVAAPEIRGNHLVAPGSSLPLRLTYSPYVSVPVVNWSLDTNDAVIIPDLADLTAEFLAKNGSTPSPSGAKYLVTTYDRESGRPVDTHTVGIIPITDTIILQQTGKDQAVLRDDKVLLLPHGTQATLSAPLLEGVNISQASRVSRRYLSGERPASA